MTDKINTDSSALPDTRLVKTRYNHTMRVDPDDYIGRKIIMHGAYDHRSIDLMRPILRKLSCRTILDVGANIGNHALAFSDLCSHLIAFEPGACAYALLSENITRNKINNITAINAGLSDQPGTATLFVDESGNLGGSTLIDENKSLSSRAEKVSLKCGDTYLESQNITNIDFIKIDVEGHEQAALTGLKETIRSQRPLILMESDKDDLNHTWITNDELRKHLLSRYHLFALIWNTDRQYWKQQPIGQLRRGLLRVFTSKRRVLTPYVARNHSVKTTNLLLVPDEKLVNIQTHIFF